MTTTDVISSFGYTGPVGRELVTAPTVTLLRVEDVRARLRLPFTDEDDQLQAFVEAAIAETEAHLGRRLLPQTWRFWYDAVPSGRVIVLPEPVRSIAAVKSYATDGDDTGTTLATTEYVLDAQRDRLVIDDGTSAWPPSSVRDYNAVSVEAAVGYATAAAVPATVIEAVHLRVQALYSRGAYTSAGITDHLAARAIDDAIVRLLAPYRYRMGVA